MFLSIPFLDEEIQNLCVWLFLFFLAGLCYYYNLQVPGPYSSIMTGINSAQDCHQQCRSNQDCIFFVFDVENGNCSFVEAETEARIRAVNIISGPRNC